MNLYKKLDEAMALSDLLQIALDHPHDTVSDNTRNIAFMRLKKLLKDIQLQIEQ